ncbi:phosphoribosylaminoimidazolesuccinocarboxamide synthase [Maridesulfovibrio frigidus]|uniref:phosphoribosylaminoimidazolesuccinocarboxamide synthase n=1 Tax=Maridesulfovibrio frigidus TaxID=340956 RepID=UPI0004E18A47|nr:phosphoribosylaminoimidazolesuccinocarboxamide synthase [Maridesulfovibrio frigidus]
MSKVHVIDTDIKELKLLSKGKVRDIYEVDAETLLIITTDRISAYDVIMPTPIEDKGKILNQITLFWMEMCKDIVPNHLIASNVDDYPEVLHKYKDQLQGRSVLVKKAKPLPIECIVRGYITGSGWKDYLATGKVSGHELPKGLQESEMLEKPLFTPSTKADLGEHDENITVDKAMEMLGSDLLEKVQDVTLAIYRRARDFAKERGIIIADTKFEFGLVGDELIVIDEVLTPDSSRFWPMEGYKAGQSQPSFDKQFLRDWLTVIDFNKQPPAPEIPENIASKTREKYLEAFKLLTSSELDA